MLLLQRYANVLPLRVLARVAVVAYVAGLGREDAVVAPELAVFAGEPVSPALAEYYVAGDYEFSCIILSQYIYRGPNYYYRLDI